MGQLQPNDTTAGPPLEPRAAQAGGRCSRRSGWQQEKAKLFCGRWQRSSRSREPNSVAPSQVRALPTQQVLRQADAGQVQRFPLASLSDLPAAWPGQPGGARLRCFVTREEVDGWINLSCYIPPRGGGAEPRQNPGPGARGRPLSTTPRRESTRPGPAQAPALAPCLWAAVQNHEGLRGFCLTLRFHLFTPSCWPGGGLPREYRPWGSQRGPRPGTSETGLPWPLTVCFSPGFSGPPADSRCHVCLIFYAVCGKASIFKEERSPSL